MKFIVSSSYLLKNLQILGGILSTSSTMPILANFLFEPGPDSLKVSASDLETTIPATIDVNSTDSGKICLPANLLLVTLRTLPEHPLTYTVSDNHTMEISSSYVT